MEATAHEVVSSLVAVLAEQRAETIEALRHREATLDEEIKRNRRDVVARYRVARRQLEAV